MVNPDEGAKSFPLPMGPGRKVKGRSFYDDDTCIYERAWSHVSPMCHDEHYARMWNFADSHADTHQFHEDGWVRAPKEVACAAAASALVSPLVSVVDKCLVQKISGTSQFMKAVSSATKHMATAPGAFFGGLGFRLTFAVYFGTYAVANMSELALDVQRVTDDELRKEGKVAASGVANVGLLAWRDSVFARVYSNSPPRPTPLRSLTCFAIRDMSTMYATFYLAPRAAEILKEKHGWEGNAAELSMALAIPAFMQLVTAPFHIHAMDFYANPESLPIRDRLNVVRKDIGTVFFARGFRILPAFGIGSFSNNKFREMFIHQSGDVELPLGKKLPIQKNVISLVIPESYGGPMLATSTSGASEGAPSSKGKL